MISQRKLLIGICVLLACVAASMAYQKYRQAEQKAAFDRAWSQAEQNAKQPELGIGEAIKTKRRK